MSRIFTQKRKEVTVQSNLYVVAFRVVAEHKKKSTCMGASVPESVGEEKKAGFVRVHYYMWETFLFFPRRTREGPSGSSQSLPGSRGGQGLCRAM